MKTSKIGFGISMLTCLALAGSVVSVRADDSASIDDLPWGAVISLPMNATIDANTGSFDLGSTSDFECHLTFAPSDQDRAMQGSLQLTIGEVNSDENGSTLSPAESQLNGRAVTIIGFECVGDDDMTIGDLRQFVQTLHGTLQLPPPVQF